MSILQDVLGVGRLWTVGFYVPDKNLQDVLGVGRLWTVGFYVPDVFLEADLQVPAGLTHI